MIPAQPRLALRIKAQREYFQLGKDFLERGIKNNPDRPQLYEAMARLYRDKYMTTNMPPSFLEKPPRCRVRRVTRSDSRPTNFHIVKAASGRRTTGCMRLYAMGENERLPTSIRS